MFTAEEKNIRIRTLENKSKRIIEDWIADWNDENEPIRFESYHNKFLGHRYEIIWIGDLDYTPIKWKCPKCGRWNYELHYMDPSGAMAICTYCHADGEF